jgi:homoprotocatechuate degradation regulator HpaR
MNIEDRPGVKRGDMLRPLSQSLPIQLLAAHDLVMRYFRPMLNRFEMTDQQWRVLRVIAAEGEVDFRKLASECLIQPASLSRMLDGLEERAWVNRRANTNDRRQRAVSLTPKGQAVFEEAAAETETLHRQLEADLGETYGAVVGMLGETRLRLESQSGCDGAKPPACR